MRRAAFVFGAFIICAGTAHGNWVQFDHPGGGDTYATGIDGTRVVGWAGGGFLYDGTTWTDLPLGQPYDIDGANIVGGSSLYDGMTVTSLPLYAEGIDGTSVVGHSGSYGDSYFYDIATGRLLRFALDGYIWFKGVDGPRIVGQYYGGWSGQHGRIYGMDPVGTFFVEAGWHGFIYDGTAMTLLDYPGGGETIPHGIEGNRIVGEVRTYGSSGFLYDGNTWTLLDCPGAQQTVAYGISGDKIVGLAYDGIVHGFLYTIPTPVGDTDGDGVPDDEDAFPNDPTETRDSDGDGIGDNSDPDRDGDAVPNTEDAFPDNANEWLDSDGDGVGDNGDALPNNPDEWADADGDGIGDNGDAFPNNPDEWADSDGDGVGDHSDAFPNDPGETLDSDGDSVGNNNDAFPNDPDEWADTDGDGVGDNADAFPNDASESVDTDGDGVGNNSDVFPNNPDEWADSDGDGVGDNGDLFPDDPTRWRDDLPPTMSKANAEPNPAAVNASVAVTATVDDSAGYASPVASATLTLICMGEAVEMAMDAQDGTFDEVIEDVVVNFPAPTAAGIYELLLKGADAAGNTCTATNIMFVVYDPTAGFVTGQGEIESPMGAHVLNPELMGRATFGFVSRYRKDATTPTGQTDFVFTAGGLQFHSSSYQWLVVTGSDYAKFKGTGVLNGVEDYKFQVWAGDGLPDTFRIRIWQENAEGNEITVYDNGFDQAIAGGSIVIHVKK